MDSRNMAERGRRRSGRDSGRCGPFHHERQSREDVPTCQNQFLSSLSLSFVAVFSEDSSRERFEKILIIINAFLFFPFQEEGKTGNLKVTFFFNLLALRPCLRSVSLAQMRGQRHPLRARGHVYMVGRHSRAGLVFGQCMVEEGKTELFGRRRVVIGVVRL